MRIALIVFGFVFVGGLLVWFASRYKTNRMSQQQPKLSTVYENPVDRKAYVVAETYEPDMPRREKPGEKVKVDMIRLLTAQDEMAERTTAEAVSAFIKDVEKVAKHSLGKTEKPFRLIAQFTCSKTGHTVRLVHQGEASKELLKGFYDALKSVTGPPVKDGEVTFQMEFSIVP